MAVPSYTTDLIDIADLDSSGGTAVEPSTLYTAGRSPIEDDTDFPIQGTVHASLTLNAVGNGGILVPGDTFTYSAGDYIFGWLIWLAPSTIDTYANGGLSMLLGSSASVFNVYYVGGSDRAPNPYGGWQNIAVLPTMTPDENAGTPTAYHYVGAGVKCISKVSKGNPLGFDVFRYGRGEVRIAGGSSGDGYATFTGIAAINDNNSNRWGLFQAIDGGYKWKGLLTFGYGALTEFVDANTSIVIDNTEWVSSDFNRIEIKNTSSDITWTAINITALGTVSKGEFEMIDNATVTIDSCTFTDMSTFIFQSNGDISNTTFRRCGQITQGGASFDNCVITKSTAASSMVATSTTPITNCTFESDGSNYAVNLGNIDADVSMSWNNTLIDYATSNGSTGNEAIYCSVASGKTLTINVTGGDAPTYHNAGVGTVTVVSSFDHIITGLELNTEVTYVTAGTTTELYHVENATVSDGDGKYKTTYSHGGGASVDILIHHVDYKPDISNIIGITLPSAEATIKVQMFEDENYYNP